MHKKSIYLCNINRMESQTNFFNPSGKSVMMVFANHLYEYKKGVRRMVLYTVNNHFIDQAVKRLQIEDIPFTMQEVGNGRTNLFFGRKECIEVVKKMINRPLQQLSPEEDFILGALLGYDICIQCERFCRRSHSYNKTQ